MAEKKKKKKSKSKGETVNHTADQAAAAAASGDWEQRYNEALGASAASKKHKRKHAASDIVSHPIDAFESLEAPTSHTPVKKKRKKQRTESRS